LARFPLFVGPWCWEFPTSPIRVFCHLLICLLHLNVSNIPVEGDGTSTAAWKRTASTQGRFIYHESTRLSGPKKTFRITDVPDAKNRTTHRCPRLKSPARTSAAPTCTCTRAAPMWKRGKVLGHENLGEVLEVGKAVERIKPADMVCLPFNISCGYCRNCRKRGLNRFLPHRQSRQCRRRVWLRGHGTLTMAGQARVPSSALWRFLNCLKTARRRPGKGK